MNLAAASRFAIRCIAAFAFLLCGAETAQAADFTMGWAIQGDTLYSIGYVAGARTVLAHGWSGATLMARTPSGYLHVIQASRFWRVDPTTGEDVPLGSAEWDGPTQMAYNLATGNLYIVQNSHSQRMNNPASKTSRSEPALSRAA
jgi:hypothetical protein